MWRRARRGLGLLGTRHVSRRYDSTHGTHHTLPPVLAAAFFVSAAAFCTFFCTVLVLRGLSLRGVTRGTVFLTLKLGALRKVGGLRSRGEERSPAAGTSFFSFFFGAFFFKGDGIFSSMAAIEGAEPPLAALSASMKSSPLGALLSGWRTSEVASWMTALMEASAWLVLCSLRFSRVCFL